MEIRNTVETTEGAGAKVRRLMPIPEFMNFDPFVLWDDFAIAAGAGFPDHPHRGFEAITYLFQGAIEHADNLGNRSTVSAGGAQRFTAGRGIVHSEMPGDEETTRGIQLWINLPQRLKGIDPAYQQVDAPNFPVHTIDGGTVKVIVGEDSPLQLLTPVRYLDIQLDTGGRFDEVIAADHRGFVYVVNGRVKVNDKTADAGDACFIADSDSVSMQAEETSRLMFCFGQPHGEPIRQYGPYVD